MTAPRLLVCCLCSVLFAILSAQADTASVILVRNGKPVHHMYCLPNDEADPAAVLALKEYRSLVSTATGSEPVRVAEPVAGTPTIFFGRNPHSQRAGVTAEVGAHQVVGRRCIKGTLNGSFMPLRRVED